MYLATLWELVIFAVVGAGVSVFGVNAAQIPKTLFSCDGRTSGYYADVSTGCQVYHMCDGLGRQFSYRCPSKTLFQQRMLICDHWYMVNCSKSEEDYSANLLIGQQNKAFIEDLQYHRTPRPDLVDPSNSDYNAYRVGEDETRATKNVVGAEEDEDSQSSTDEPKYFPPSHWSTEFSARSSTPTPNKREETGTVVPGLVQQTFYRTSYNTGNKLSQNVRQSQRKDSNVNSINRFDSNVRTVGTKDTADGRGLPDGINFPSRFKATTPVYPQHLDIDMSKFNDFGNPLEENVDVQQGSVNFPSKFQATTPVYPKHVETDISRLSEFDFPVDDRRHLESNVDSNVFVNFASNFKATTPVYPSHVDVDPSKLSEFDFTIDNKNEEIASVNFASKFKATTPVYPQHVDVDLTKFSGSEEVPPEQTGSNIAVVNFASNFKATTPVYPQHVDVDLSKFEEPVELPEDKSVGNNTVNFRSNFKATTPVYPQSVEATSPIPDQVGLLPPAPSSQLQGNLDRTQQGNLNYNNNVNVNFASNFQATTPVYPRSVEPTSPDPSNVGLLAPQPTAQALESIQPSIDIRPPSFDTTFKRRIDEEDPSVIGNTFSSRQLTEFMLTIKPEQLKDLKQLWHIPDYDFPLDSTASRPGYGSDLSSFQAVPKDFRSS